MTLTPTAQSSAIAGFALWLVGWMTLFKVDHIPLIGRFFKKDRTIDWVLQNKVLTLLMTEIFNFGVHGITQATAVTFALGGTIFNVLMIFIFLPTFYWRRNYRSNKEVLRGNV